MKTKLLQLEQRIQELEGLADEVAGLAEEQTTTQAVPPDLNSKGQRWYRGAREILATQNSSSLREFDGHYTRIIKDVITSSPFVVGDRVGLTEFQMELRAARALVIAVTEELKSRELPLRTQLSFSVSADELDSASELVNASSGDETFLRAAGVVGRVALERHLWTVLESHGLPVTKNPPHKKKADTQDILTALVKAAIVTPIQKSEFDGLFTIGNNCAHPKEVVTKPDVERLISRGRELASIIL